MAGTISLSMTQQFDPLGDPLAGGKLYFIVAGTTSTPQNAFQDLGLTNPWPNPITLDAAGRVPQLFIADVSDGASGLIKIRLTDQHGVTQLVADNVQVIGPSGGGGPGPGPGPAIDPTTIAQTGDLKPRYGTGAHTGWVRCNGNTIGSAVSGATERANADAQALFDYLWSTDPNLVVLGGRGASSAADWSANKQIATPDWRGRALTGLDGMGAAAAGRLTAAYFGTAADVLGAAGGAESHTLTTTELPSHNHTLTDPGHEHTVTFRTSATGPGSFEVISPFNAAGSHYATSNAPTGVSIAAAGGGAAHAIASPALLVTIYLKL